MPLYNIAIGLPEKFDKPPQGMTLEYSRHAEHEASKEGLKKALPFTLPPYALQEVELVNGKVSKWVVRFPTLTKPNYDWVMVITPSGFVKTVWLNHKFDHHATLRVARYARSNQ